MTLKELRSGLASGKITFDRKGHLTNDIDHDLDHQIEFNEKMIDQYTETLGIPEVDQDQAQKLINFYKWKNEVSVGDTIFDMHDVYCFECGANCSPVMINDTTLALITNNVKHKLYDTMPEKYKYLIKETDISTCEFLPIKKQGYLRSEIEVPTGEIVFANYFDQDKFYKNEKHRGEKSINSTLGRDVLMQDLAKENIGYGQMGNMSVTLFVKNDGTEIIVSTEFGYNKEDGEFEVEHDGFIPLGQISLSVWRWQCGDKKILLDGGEKLPDDLKISNEKHDGYEELIAMRVKPGRWEIKHYYDFFTEEMDDAKAPIYSHLKLIQ